MKTASSATLLNLAREHVRSSTLAEVDNYLRTPNLSVYRDLKGMCETVSHSYRERVVLELLQNAHDAHDPAARDGRVYLLLDPHEGRHGTLYVANDGQGFTAPNFDALRRPSGTTKTVNEAIGNKGVGFLSVFQVCAHPQVYSRASPQSGGFDGYCFEFGDDEAATRFLAQEGRAAHARDILDNLPRLYLACPAPDPDKEVARLGALGYATVVRLALKSADAFASVARQVAKLDRGETPVQIFLPRLAELTIEDRSRSDAPVPLSRDTTLLASPGRDRLREVRCGARSYIVVERDIPFETVIAAIGRDVAAQKLPEAWSHWEGDATISLAVAAEGEPLAPQLYNFLPMDDDAKAPFDGYLDAPFFASINRLHLQRDVEFNTLLLAECRKLALAGALIGKTVLPTAQAKRVVADLLFWHGSGRDELRAELIAADPAIIPAIGSDKAKAWAKLSSVIIWREDAFATSDWVARVADVPIVDPVPGAKRLARLQSFTLGTGTLVCSDEMRVDVAEALADDLLGRAAPAGRWDEYYLALARLFKDDPQPLLGRRVLLSSRGELIATETLEPALPRGGRRRGRLSAVFLPSLRGNDTAADTAQIDLPLAVQRRLAYVDDRLALTRERASTARRFLVAAGLVREFESREILRLLAGAIIDTGEAKDPEALRWAALTAMMEIVAAEDTAAGVVAEINMPVPVRSGWARAATAFFGTWQDTQGRELERLLDQVLGLSVELDEHAGRLLRPYRDWPVAAGRQPDWLAFLRKAGVVDHLRPVPAITGPVPRAIPSRLASALAQRATIGPEQAAFWRALMQQTEDLPNPLTDYTATDVFRLPGQADYAAIAPVAGSLYARQVIRLLNSERSVLQVTVYKPTAAQQGRRFWPSPIAAFVRKAPWLTASNGERLPIERVWLPSVDGRTPPAPIPLVDLELRPLFDRYEKAAEALRSRGLARFGSKASAWKLLRTAGELIAQGADQAIAERLLAASLDAWQLVPLDAAPPSDLRLIGRQSGLLMAIAPGPHDGSRLLLADGDDRQMVAATARAAPGTIIVELPAGRAGEIAAYLASRYPSAVERASALRARYEEDGIALAFNAGDVLVEDELGPVLREIVALTLRYRPSAHGSRVEDALARLAALRLRWMTSLSLRVGDSATPVEMFAERAVLFQAPEGATLLVSHVLRGSPKLLVGIAEAIGEALGHRRTTGEALLGVAALLGNVGLTASHEDLARVLGVPLADVDGVLGATRASVAGLLRLLRPFVALWIGDAAANDFAPGGLLASEHDIVAALAAGSDDLPVAPEELLRRARESTGLDTMALALQVDLVALNATVGALGPPYQIIDRTAAHEATLAAFLDRQENRIKEAIRFSFRASFAVGDSLAAYVATRDAARPQLPSGYGVAHLELPQSSLRFWLDQWLAERSVAVSAELPAGRLAMDAVREANLKLLRSLAPTLRLILLARGNPAMSAQAWETPASAEQALSASALAGGWIDFDRLDETATLTWLARADLWPTGWPLSTVPGDHGLSDEDLNEARRADAAARKRASADARHLDYSGGRFTFGVDSLGGIADHITRLLASNAALLATSSRALRGETPLAAHKGHQAGNGGGKGNRVRRLSDEERDLIGFFGEAIAFDWLKQRFGKPDRIIDERCWKSRYRRHVFGEDGSDALGYDFEIAVGKTSWYFEVKATSGTEALSRQAIDLGSSEIARAELCRSERRSRYRILYIVDALHPEAARLFVLPNPRSREGLIFFAEQESAGVRLHFGLTGTR